MQAEFLQKRTEKLKALNKLDKVVINEKIEEKSAEVDMSDYLTLLKKSQKMERNSEPIKEDEEGQIE